MRKILTLFTTLLLLGSAVSAATRTIYLDASNWYPPGSTFAIHVWGGSADGDFAFVNKVGDIYKVDISDDATNAIFLRCDASNFNLSNVWDSEWNRSTTTLSSDKDFYTVNGWSSSSSDGSDYGTWSTYVPLPSYTFTSGTTIYYDFTEYIGGVNVYINGSSPYYETHNSIFSVTLSSDWEVSASTNLFRSGAGGWADHACATLPTEGQNMLVSTDGINCHWDTYVPLVTPSVSFTSLGSTIAVNQDVKFSATSNNIGGAGIVASSYKFYVNNVEVSGEHYQFASAGNYTIKVEAYDSSNNKKAEATQDVEVVSGAHVIYFVKNNAWPRVHAHMWDEAVEHMTTWPGDEMTLTNAETDRNHYAVYAVAFTIDYDHIIFDNNGETQTSNLDLDFAKPYYYDGNWFATLAECDSPLTTKFYLVGSFNGWNTNANYFKKATEDATEASVTITIDEYSNITFKVIDNGAWCGSNDAITKDVTTATIAASGGENVQMTPYAAGDYIFTLKLDGSRELTVTYPEGSQMPIPANIYLSCDKLNSWAAADPAYKFTVSGDIATLEVDLAEKTDYAFKLVHNASWYGANWNFNYYWNTDVQMVYEETEAHLYTFMAGVHTFTYTISTGLLTIGFPATTATEITIGSYEYATLFSAKGFDVPNVVEAYMITGNSGTALTLERIYRIPAETGVLLHAPQGTYNFYEGDSRFMGVEHTEDNLLKGTLDETTIADNGKIHYVLSYDNSGNVGFFWPNGTGDGIGDFTNGARKAYLELGSQSAGIIARRGFPLVVGQATGIDALKNGEKAVKFIENGQLFILRDGKLYNAQGLIVK